MFLCNYHTGLLTSYENRGSQHNLWPTPFAMASGLCKKAGNRAQSVLMKSCIKVPDAHWKSLSFQLRDPKCAVSLLRRCNLLLNHNKLLIAIWDVCSEVLPEISGIHGRCKTEPAIFVLLLTLCTSSDLQFLVPCLDLISAKPESLIRVL